MRVNIKNREDFSYDIVIENRIIDKIPKLCKEFSKNFIIITDSNVKEILGNRVFKIFKKNNLSCHIISFPAGEKTRQMKEKIEDRLLELKVKRDACIVALGGGVVGDLAGFVAATYLRGVSLIQIPTSLLAMVDSSIGGKVAIDTSDAKNCIGAFYQPKKVIIDVSFLKTLPKEEITNGLAEVIKHGLIRDKEFFEFVEKNIDKILKLDSKTLIKVIEWSCKIKASVVEKDEKEAGLRKILNYGHTFGHAIESANNISHGNAISIGMNYAAKLSLKLGFLDEESVTRQNKLLLAAGLPIQTKENLYNVIDLVTHDKKILNGKLNFILLNSIGDAFVNDKITIKDLEGILE